MIYSCLYKTTNEFDNILMKSDGEYLTELNFITSKDEQLINCQKDDLPIFKETCKWLDIYFSGEEPNFKPKYRIDNLTPFRSEVIDIMNTIPFGKTITYNDIAKIIAKRRNINKMSGQAVGGAVGWNPICIIVPCHRVVGASGNLTGYGGGMNNKVALLNNEKIDMSNYYIPNKK